MPESEGNEFTSFSLFSPSRPPLNSIPDPSQFQKTMKLELARTQQGPSERRLFEGRGAGAHDSNPRKKVQLSSLVKSHNSSGALSDCIASLEEPRYSGKYELARKTQQQDKCHSQVNNSLRKKENEVEKEFEDCRKMNSSLVRELAEMLEENDGSMKLLNNKSNMEREAVPRNRIEGHDFELSRMANNTDAVMKADEGTDRSVLQFKLTKVIKELEEAKTLNCQYEKEQKLLLSQQQNIEVTITAREAETRALNQDWDKDTSEPTNFTVDVSKSFKDASTQIERKNPATKMTSRLPFFFFSLFLFTVTTLVSTASGATSCRSSCGSIQINYPFGIDKGCGSPQFNGMLNCSSTDLFFFTPSGGYKVRSIDYDKNTMVVFDPLMSTCSILQPHHDFKLSDIQNALIRPSYDTVFALFNCSSVSPVQNRYKSLCFNAAGHSCDELYSTCTSFRIFNTTSPYGNSTVHATPYCCFTSYDTVRVMSMNILDCSHYTTVIDDGKMRGVAPIDWSYGIELSYSAPEIGCSPCRKSGGTCGYDDETEIFLCQCSNNISPRDCGGVSDRGGSISTKANYATLLLVMLVSFIYAIL